MVMLLVGNKAGWGDGNQPVCVCLASPDISGNLVPGSAPIQHPRGAYYGVN